MNENKSIIDSIPILPGKEEYRADTNNRTFGMEPNFSKLALYKTYCIHKNL